MALTLDDALDRLGAKFCAVCAAKLPVVGGQCPACGALPALTRSELAEALAEPGALAKAEAKDLRAEAERLRDDMMDKLREADRVLHASSLLSARDRAQAALEAAHDRQRQADGVLREAGKAEEAAAGPAREAYENHRTAQQDEEAARRFRKGPTAEAEALDKLTVRAAVLARYQAPLQEATAARQEAEALAEAAAGDVKAAEEARDQAVWGHEHLGYIPLSGETVNIPAQPLTRFVLGVDLDDGPLSDVDRMLAALPGWSMAVMVGLPQDAENKARASERKVIAAEEAKRPRVVNATTALAPGSVKVPGGLYSPGVSSPR